MKGENSIKLHERFNHLAYWFRYQATYLEMKYHLKQVLIGKEDHYIKGIYHYDRNIGKSTALARLSVKYDIPVVVPTQKWKILIEYDIPRYLPKYFKKKKPVAVVANENLRGIKLKHNTLLMEEGLKDEQFSLLINKITDNFVGYRNY